MENKKQYYKDYYKNNKDKIQQQRKVKNQEFFKCDICDKNIKLSNKYLHNKSQKHLFLKKNKEENNKLLEQKIIEVLRRLIDF